MYSAPFATLRRESRRVSSRFYYRFCTPPAHANGALPGSLSILTPTALPHDVTLATNFGVVLTHDDGQHWIWSCEQPGNAFGILYQQGPGPLNRIFTISSDQHTGMPQLAFSDDDSCTWGVATVSGGRAPVVDAFADPTDATRVLGVAVVPTDGGSVYQLFESSDGGSTLSKLLYTAAGSDFITGVETARSEPRTIYMTMGSGIPSKPVLVRSTDGGMNWQTFALSALLGTAPTVRLFAIDPDNPARVFLRVSSGGVNDSVVVATTAASDVALQPTLSLSNGVITAFARLANGHIFVGGTVGVTPAAYLSVDNGASFQPLPTPPALKGASARAGTLYAVADVMIEDFAVATSVDEGQSWQPFMRYGQIQAIQACTKVSCQDDCHFRAYQGQWPEELCDADDPTTPPTDGGAPTDGGPLPDGGAPTDAAVDGPVGHTDAAADAGTTPSKSGGCGCDAPGQAAGPVAIVALAALLAAGRRKRRGARISEPRGPI